MQIPKTLKIGGHEVRVEFPFSFTDASGGPRWCGYAHVDENRIQLGEENYGDDNIKQTFLHEIVHFVDSIYCGRAMLDEHGDKFIDTLTQGLFQVLKDNRLAFWEPLERPAAL